MYNMYPNYSEEMSSSNTSESLTLRADLGELAKWGMDGASDEDFEQARNVAIAERASAVQRGAGFISVNPMVLE